MRAAASSAFGADWDPALADELLEQRAVELQQIKYSQPSYNQGR